MKNWLKTQHSENEDRGIRSHHFMGNRWRNSETVADFIFGGPKITADGDCSHEIKRRLLLGRKVMTNLDSIFKSREITWPQKVRLVKAMVFPVVMYGCESWTLKKADHQRIDAFVGFKEFFLLLLFFFLEYMCLFFNLNVFILITG